MKRYNNVSFIRKVIGRGIYHNCTFIECYFDRDTYCMMNNKYIACLASEDIVLNNKGVDYMPPVIDIKEYQQRY